MNLFGYIHRYKRLILALTAMFMLLGIASWLTMARQEDPSFPYRTGTIRVVFPGVSAEQIEKLITEPLEEQLAEVEELRRVKSTSRDNVAIFVVELLDRIYDTNAAWDRVRRAMEKAEQDFPKGVVEYVLEDRRMDIPAAVISIVGTADILELAHQAEILKRQLLAVNGVSRIEIEGDPEKELRIDLDSAILSQLSINRDQVVAAIQVHNQIIPGGVVRIGDHALRVDTGSDLQQKSDVESIPIRLATGQYIPLSAIAHIAFVAREPSAAQTYHNGMRSVSLGVYAKRGQVDAIVFGEQIRQRIDAVSADYQPLEIVETFFQPDYVADRLEGLQFNLLGSILIIAITVIAALGWRNGLLVAGVLPVVAIIVLALYNLGGGVLHQIAVIGIVISLGILVDNAIVVVESIVQELQAGRSRREAVESAFEQMAFPLFTSTGTTVAAFIPLLLSKGGTGDFTRGIPVMIILSLLVSYVISVLVLPLVAERLVGIPKHDNQRWIKKISDKLIYISRYKAKLALLLVVGVMALTIMAFPLLKLQFFPQADRNQVVIDMTLPGDSSLERMAEVSADVEQKLLARDDVVGVMRSVGMSGFRFYYNLLATIDSTNSARLMVNTRDMAANQAVIDWITHDIQTALPEATIIAKRLGQGPPTPAPVELRLQSDEPSSLYQAADQVLAILNALPETTMIRSDKDSGLAELSVNIDKTIAQELGVRRDQVAASLFGQTRGLDAGEFLYSDDPITMRVRSAAGDLTTTAELSGQYIYNATGQSVPLDAVATLKSQWTSAVIRHYKGIPTVTIHSELMPGAAYNTVLKKVFAALDENPLPGAVTLQLGGDAEGSADANRAILKSVPIGVMLLLLFMLVQFNSFRRLTIILATIPLAAVGIIPGLVLSDQPFGFQSLLGVIALIGIVVNNAIVLLDVVDARLREGADIDSAVAQSIDARTAPILLTTATTVLGLLPLAFSASTLWPPMAWAIISGLLMSTLLTLIVIPVLCRMMLKTNPVAM
ncbi:MAG: efflux RND transporter permease subunit [Thalassolituus sp.]|uniref:efflux RND transporter permease subunit n=1 Tax=Thalassolituus sp. TaxID=2030822 RepID=UPI003982D448